MRILIASQTYYPGTNGQAVFTIRLAEGLARAGHAVRVVAPASRDGAPSGQVNGVEVHAAPSWPLAWLHPAVVVTPRPGRDARAALEGFQPEVVHIQDHYFLCASVARAAHARGLPILGTNHFLPENVLPNLSPALAGQPWAAGPAKRLLWAHMLGVFNHLDAATTPSETAARLLRAQPIRIPVHAISCGVDLGRFRPLPASAGNALRERYRLPTDQPLLAYVGRLDREKRLDLLVRALAELPAGAAHLVIAGHGLAVAELRALAERLGVAGHVTFTGHLPAEDVPAMLNAADIFVMPSPEELQSIATLEALATGRPVIAADARALPELVEHGVNGFLFRPGDAADLAHWTAALLAAPELRRAMSAANLARGSAHGLDTTIQRYLSLYQGLAEARAARAAAPASQRASARAGAPD